MLKAIKIGGIRYAVIADNRLIDSLRSGEMRHMRAEIAVLPDATPELLPQTLWHEVLHAVLLHAGERQHDETVLDVLAYGIVQVLRDNPVFAQMTVATHD
jgi:hypothetical protein